MTLIHSAGELNHLPALFTCHLIDEANGPIAMQLQRVCHDTLPWLISFSLAFHQAGRLGSYRKKLGFCRAFRQDGRDDAPSSQDRSINGGELPRSLAWFQVSKRFLHW